MTVYVLWDIGPDSNGRLPTFDDPSRSKVIQALIITGGKLCHTAISYRGVHYQISLPEGSREAFEDLAGYSLIVPEKEL